MYFVLNMKKPFIYIIQTSLLLFCLVFFFCFSCKKSEDNTVTPIPPVVADSTFAKGADISWVTEMESVGKFFYNSSGSQQDAFQLLDSLGMNTIRLRVWVNPTTGWNNKADVVAKAIRAKNAGMRIMIDFHYSDTWADPGNQTKPNAWASLSFSDLKTALYNHTKDVLTALKTANIKPEWVQVGNETNDGMLWPEGKASTNMNAFSQLISAGYDAVKAIFPAVKVIVHISNGNDNALFRWIFDGLKNNGAKWDVIGMSLYPNPSDWSTKNTQCLANMNDMVARYSKEVMVVETGMPWDQAASCKSFITDLIAKTKSVTSKKGIGILYWEPESYGSWNGYTLGAFDNSGKPTIALDPFK